MENEAMEGYEVTTYAPLPTTFEAVATPRKCSASSDAGVIRLDIIDVSADYIAKALELALAQNLVDWSQIERGRKDARAGRFKTTAEVHVFQPPPLEECCHESKVTAGQHH